VLDKGAKNVEILKQGQYSPVSVERQIAIIYCGTKGLLSGIPVKKVKDFEQEYLDYLEMKHKDLMKNIAKGVLTENEMEILKKTAEEIAARYEK
jgi:F-type H+-transporting ATPase subunit alpha